MITLKKISDVSLRPIPKLGFASLFLDDKENLNFMYQFPLDLDQHNDTKLVIKNYDIKTILEKEYLRPINKIVETENDIEKLNLLTLPENYRIICKENHSIYELQKTILDTGYDPYFIVQDYTKLHGRAQYLELIGSWIIFDGGINYTIANGDLSHSQNFNNPHKVTKEQVGLGNVLNIVQASQADFIAHVNDHNNPHRTTKEQLDLDKVENINHASKEEFDRHVNDKTAHNLTKEQVGLGNVLNILQMTDEDLKNHINDYNNPHRITKEDIGLGNIINKEQITKEQLRFHILDQSNPHKVTKESIGLGNVINEQQISVDVFYEHVNTNTNIHNVTLEQLGLGNLNPNIGQIPQETFDQHINDKTAHNVTKEDIGLGNVLNVLQATKSEFDNHNNNHNNPHRITKKQIGLDQINNVHLVDKEKEFDQHLIAKNPHNLTKEDFGLGDIENIPSVSNKDFQNHLIAKNPHNLTKEQVGLRNVPNVLQASKEEFDQHVSDKTAHNLTKEQVGLGQINNTSDINKPISNLQQIELNKYLKKEPIKGKPFIKIVTEKETIIEKLNSDDYVNIDDLKKITKIGDYDGIEISNSLNTNFNGKNLDNILTVVSEELEGGYLEYIGEDVVVIENKQYGKGSIITRCNKKWQWSNNPTNYNSIDEILVDTTVAGNNHILKDIAGTFKNYYENETTQYVMPDRSLGENTSLNPQMTKFGLSAFERITTKRQFSTDERSFLKENVIKDFFVYKKKSNIADLTKLISNDGHIIMTDLDESHGIYHNSVMENSKIIGLHPFSLCKTITSLNTDFIIGIPKDNVRYYVVEYNSNYTLIPSNNNKIFFYYFRQKDNMLICVGDKCVEHTSSITTETKPNEFVFTPINLDIECDVQHYGMIQKLNGDNVEYNEAWFYNKLNKQFYVITETTKESITKLDVLTYGSKDPRMTQFNLYNPAQFENYYCYGHVRRSLYDESQFYIDILARDRNTGLLNFYSTGFGAAESIIKTQLESSVINTENIKFCNDITIDFYLKDQSCIIIIPYLKKFIKWKWNGTSVEPPITYDIEGLPEKFEIVQRIGSVLRIDNNFLVCNIDGTSKLIYSDLIIDPLHLKILPSLFSYQIYFTRFIENSEVWNFRIKNDGLKISLSINKNTNIKSDWTNFICNNLTNHNNDNRYVICTENINEFYDSVYLKISNYTLAVNNKKNILKSSTFSNYDVFVKEKSLEEDIAIVQNTNPDIIDCFDLSFEEKLSNETTDEKLNILQEFVINNNFSMILRNNGKLYINEELLKINSEFYDEYEFCTFAINPYYNKVICIVKKKSSNEYIPCYFELNIDYYNNPYNDSLETISVSFFTNSDLQLSDGSDKLILLTYGINSYFYAYKIEGSKFRIFKRCYIQDNNFKTDGNIESDIINYNSYECILGHQYFGGNLGSLNTVNKNIFGNSNTSSSDVYMELTNGLISLSEKDNKINFQYRLWSDNMRGLLQNSKYLFSSYLFGLRYH